jgi:RNA polymerase sigma-70 factor (ECF subfamily)
MTQLSAEEHASFDFQETRSSLIGKLGDTNAEEWDDFFRLYRGLIYNFARKAGLSDADSQEIVQETVLKFYKNKDKFKYDRNKGSFRGWLRLVTRRCISDHFRKWKPKPREGSDGNHAVDLLADMDELEDPKGHQLEALWDQEWINHMTDQALEQLKQQVSAQHFQVFHCIRFQDWKPSEVADTLGLKRSNVDQIKGRVERKFAAIVSAMQDSSDSVG